MLAKRHKLVANWDHSCQGGDVTAIRYADGAAIKDSFGHIAARHLSPADHRAPLAISGKARRTAVMASEGAAKMYRHLRLCC
jgi:hypothetical protein